MLNEFEFDGSDIVLTGKINIDVPGYMTYLDPESLAIAAKKSKDEVLVAACGYNKEEIVVLTACGKFFTFNIKKYNNTVIKDEHKIPYGQCIPVNNGTTIRITTTSDSHFDIGSERFVRVAKKLPVNIKLHDA